MDNSAFSQAIVILGMHRSGTSALAGLLHILGADVGSDLLSAQEAVNPKGFWEHSRVVELHEELLREIDSAWDDAQGLQLGWDKSNPAVEFRMKLLDVLQQDFSGSSLWLVKDPRICRLLPAWREVFERLNAVPKFILTLRHPLEVAQSLNKRDGMHEGRACLLWLIHMLDAELNTRGRARAIIEYSALLEDWRTAIKVVTDALGIPFDLGNPERCKKADEFLETTLRHHRACHVANDEEDGFVSLAIDCYQIFKSKQLQHIGAELDGLRTKVNEKLKNIHGWNAEVVAGNKPSSVDRESFARISQTYLTLMPI